MSAEWNKFLKANGFKTEILLNEIPKEDLRQFIDSTREFLPKSFRDVDPSINILKEETQYIFFTFRNGEEAYMLCGKADGEISGSYRDSIIMRIDKNISALWQKLLKEQTDVLLQAQI